MNPSPFEEMQECIRTLIGEARTETGEEFTLMILHDIEKLTESIGEHILKGEPYEVQCEKFDQWGYAPIPDGFRSEMKPCPFCGSASLLIVVDDPKDPMSDSWVTCIRCDAGGPIRRRTRSHNQSVELERNTGGTI